MWRLLELYFTITHDLQGISRHYRDQSFYKAHCNRLCGSLYLDLLENIAYGGTTVPSKTIALSEREY